VPGPAVLGGQAQGALIERERVVVAALRVGGVALAQALGEQAFESLRSLLPGDRLGPEREGGQVDGQHEGGQSHSRQQAAHEGYPHPVAGSAGGRSRPGAHGLPADQPEQEAVGVLARRRAWPAVVGILAAAIVFEEPRLSQVHRNQVERQEQDVHRQQQHMGQPPGGHSEQTADGRYRPP